MWPMASSGKRQAAEVWAPKARMWPMASSGKRQAASGKRQAELV
jgi:hypothetical protein